MMIVIEMVMMMMLMVLVMMMMMAHAVIIAIQYERPVRRVLVATRVTCHMCLYLSDHLRIELIGVRVMTRRRNLQMALVHLDARTLRA